MKKTFNLFLVLDNLNNIPRTGGILFGAVSPEKSLSIAEHSFAVSYITLVLGEIANQHNLKIDQEKLLKAAITHDWSGSILLDLPSGSPSYQSYFHGVNYRQLFEAAEKEAFKVIEKYLEDEIKIKLSKIENLSKEEITIIKTADLMAFLLEILNWKYQGLKYEWFDYLWSNTLEKLKENINKDFLFLISLINDFEDAYKSGRRPFNPFLTMPKFQTYKKSK